MSSLISGHLKTGFNGVRSAKLRSFWTMLGVIIGVASVITVVSIGEGVKQQIGGQIQHIGQHVITVRPAQLQTGSGAGSGVNLISGLGVSGPLGAKDISIISHAKGVAASAPLTIVSGAVSGDNGQYKDGFVIGTSSDLASLINQPMAYGSFFDSQDDGDNVAVLGSHASDVMFNEDVPLGRSFSFHGQRFVVRGAFSQFASAPLSQQADLNNAIFISNSIAEDLSKDTAPTYEVLARPADGQSTNAVVNNISQALDAAHGGQSGFSVLPGYQSAVASENILDLLTRLIAGIAAISLLVGGVGIMNVMLVSVAERMHEIGIRKAVGATNRQIMSQFMIESSVLSFAGGAIGIALAFLLDIGLRLFTSLKPIISWQVVLLASGVSLLVGIIFGTVPAIKAAWKAPIDALRSE